MNTTTKIICICIIGMALFLLTGCNTVAGFGTDIQKSAEWTKEKMGGSSTSTTKGDAK